jgi:2-polyprenyl-3-methyl-5-hydroxy-6-metoxy-1,4-benzoquinol methylase
MKWTDSLFIDNARYYAMVLESQWKNGIEGAKLLSDLFKEKRMKKCRVLDIPCGIGRVSVPLARLGHTVSGVDFSPYFVRVAKKKSRQFGVSKRTTFAVGNMKEVGSLFPSGQFDAAINIFTSIGFGSEADDLEFFRGLRQVVRKGGMFVISRLTNRDFVFSHFSGNQYYETDLLVVLQKAELDVLHSRVRSKWRFYRKHGRSLKYATENSLDSRLYSPHELVRMLEEADWKTTAIYDSLAFRRPYSPDSPHITLIAEAT